MCMVADFESVASYRKRGGGGAEEKKKSTPLSVSRGTRNPSPRMGGEKRGGIEELVRQLLVAQGEGSKGHVKEDTRRHHQIENSARIMSPVAGKRKKKEEGWKKR